MTGAVGTGSSGIGTYTVTFAGSNANLAVPGITVGANNLVGTSPTVAVATTTTGVGETIRGAYQGTQIYDYVNNRSWVGVNSVNNLTFVRSGTNVAVIPLTGVASTSGGGQGTWQPAEGGPIIIFSATLYVVAASTGAANMNVGFGSSATTSYTNLITAVSVHTANTVFDSITQQIIAATAGESGIAALHPYLAAANFVTITNSATAAGMTGFPSHRVSQAVIAIFSSAPSLAGRATGSGQIEKQGNKMASDPFDLENLRITPEEWEKLRPPQRRAQQTCLRRLRKAEEEVIFWKDLLARLEVSSTRSPVA